MTSASAGMACAAVTKTTPRSGGFIFGYCALLWITTMTVRRQKTSKEKRRRRSVRLSKIRAAGKARIGNVNPEIAGFEYQGAAENERSGEQSHERDATLERIFQQN